LDVADHLPAEAAEALLELATGGKPRVPQPVTAVANPFDHLVAANCRSPASAQTDP